MKVLVTGCAGFIGSSIARKHIGLGDAVIGADCFTTYYDLQQKRSNLCDIVEKFDYFHDRDLLLTDLDALLSDVDVVYHQAGQPGVRKSWGADFEEYTANNVRLTQMLLEAAKRSTRLSRFVYASSSSVYGDSESYPTDEGMLPRPMSPYGVTKLAAEHLATLYAKNYGVPTVSLRYFTVYGPRQRPDMAFHRFIRAHLNGEELQVYGDGTQIRDFTFVDDVVEANIAAANSNCVPGTVINVAGGSSVSVNRILELIGEISGRAPRISNVDKIAGDVYRTGGSIERAQKTLGWTPRVSIEDGLRLEFDWLKNL
ncbi:NAD-dependent epimerase/dehydratase family protein [Rhodococcus sp. GXMU-t2271]|uniref:NAD-dependent epimerase/dehydratase family protein n=1 Tax=Rhodococcus sp. GXMU-t2271 TaxID=3059079 RepID=UPI00352A1E0E